eukprot:symbB.v1.2.035194.t1/scaffold4684.1/size36451/2
MGHFSWHFICLAAFLPAPCKAGAENRGIALPSRPPPPPPPPRLQEPEATVAPPVGDALDAPEVAQASVTDSAAHPEGPEASRADAGECGYNPCRFAAMHHHRSSTKEKQSSKRNASKGRVETTRSSVKKLNTAAISKQDRLNTLKQLREAKKEEIFYKKRFGAELDDRPLPPKVVCLVGFHTQADPLSLKRKILSLCGYSSEDLAKLPPHQPAVASLPNWAQGPGMGKPRVLLIDPPRTVFGVLDAAKCADVVLCVVGPHASLEEPAFDDLGYKTLTALKAQGLPVVFGAMHGSSTSMETSAKKQGEAKKFVTRYFHSELGAETRLFAASTDEEAKTMIRAVAASTPKELTWRGGRGYMLAQDIQYSPQEGSLSLQGYVRGPGFRCSNLVHLTGHGDFVVERISTLNDPCPIGSGHSTDAAVQMAAENVVDELGLETQFFNEISAFWRVNNYPLVN